LIDFVVVTTLLSSRNEVEGQIYLFYPGAQISYQGEHMRVLLSGLRGWDDQEEDLFGGLYYNGYIGLWQRFARRCSATDWFRG
jgi:hypothetical protein